jgi:hypothetical protein
MICLIVFCIGTALFFNYKLRDDLYVHLVICCKVSECKEEIKIRYKRRLNSGNACYHSVQNLLSSHLLSKNLKFRIYKNIILPLVFMGVKLGL